MAVIITDDSEYSHGWRDKSPRQKRYGVIAFAIFGMAILLAVGLYEAMK